MPIYSYRCESCGVQFEKTQSFNDKPLTRCPECRTGRVHRVLGAPAIVFKGSGWYKTDSRSSSSSTLPAGKSSKSSNTSTDKPAKSEPAASKPASDDD